MTPDSILNILAIVLSLASVGLSGWFSVRTQRLSHQLEEERQARLDAQSAIKAAEKVYEPLAQAAAELQSRIYNIVESGWVDMQHRYSGHGDYAVSSTAFLFAHYFGWIEARRQAVLGSSGEGRRDESVQEHIDGVLKVLRRSEGSGAFLFFTAEQRAIGELMLEWEQIGDTGIRIPKVQGYAAFLDRYRDDDKFRGWFAPVHSGMDAVSEGDHLRLVKIQHALVELIEDLDPKQKYTAGYDLEKIS